MPSTVVRDPVHDLVELSPEEWNVVDSPAFQRLRRIQQLALTSLVYPGAHHARFEHCIGACHLAGKVSTQIASSEDEKRQVRLAALLHDVGHGPFSHVSEEVAADLAPENEGGGHIHERIGAAIVRHHPGIVNVIGLDTAEWIAELLAQEGHARLRSVWRDIVAGPADVDKLDYLLRDSHYCGVNYGRYDLGKVSESADRIDEERESFLAFRADGIHALEEMLLARHHMHRQVYGHKTRVATDLMLRRAIGDAVQHGVLPRNVFVPPADIDEGYVEEYLRWDDRRVLDTLIDSGDGVHREIALDLCSRRLITRVAVLRHETLSERAGLGQAGYLLSRDIEKHREGIQQAEEAIARELLLEPQHVHLYWRRLGEPLGHPSRTGLTEKDILLVSPEYQQPQEFHVVSEVFGSVDTEPRRDSILLYARLPDGTAEADAREEFEQRARAVTLEALAAIERPL